MNYSPRIIASVCLPDMFTSEICIYHWLLSCLLAQ
ncbi:hypothetical protein ACNF5A_002494 [Kosakonia cowanii]